ncbi:hypothetical protein N657DRAFT_657114 [Parathielavia appendiculata]|uniref:Uncharacterized protein n=1 Tax=Parathielavia appendiculata TaxID=2587402 RepID=A0AAN6TWZ5_9PEZI|nr:hypothetical protein N657DRAFT_657114 [Parathielavia appendiculata]
MCHANKHTRVGFAELSVLLQQPVSEFARGDLRNPIQVRLPGLCRVCYNLDPYAAPQDRPGEDGPPPWARAEYTIRPGTPIANIKVDESPELLESYGAGTIPTLRTAMQSLLDLGLVRPEGSTVNWEIEIAIEIYRQNIALEQETGNKLVESDIETYMLHPKCSRPGHLPKLPDRVIWVKAPSSETPSGIRLAETQMHRTKRAPYLTLSYCWGPVSPLTFLTDASTLEARKAGIAYADLPPLFQNAVDLAILLGIEYVGSTSCSKMGTIYGNATLTICSASATSESDRNPVDRVPRWSTYDIIRDASIGRFPFQVRRRSQRLGMEARGGDYGKYQNERGYGKSSFGEGMTSPAWSAQLDNVTHRTRMDMVEEYTQRAITRPSDRLPAMAAIMRRIAKARGWSPLYGMWADAPVDSLGWRAKKWDGPVSRHLRRVHPGFYAPTWSWASVEGPVSYLNVKRTDPHDLAVADLEVGKWDAAVITVNGRDGELRQSSSGKNIFDYRYAIPGLARTGNSDGAMPITADVALQPWTGVVNGENASTRQTLRCLVLVLGRLPRIPRAWERIATVAGPETVAFDLAEKIVLDIA